MAEKENNEKIGAETKSSQLERTGEMNLEVPKKELTKEEQMALYEKELKESDWGHQPC